MPLISFRFVRAFAAAVGWLVAPALSYPAEAAPAVHFKAGFEALQASNFSEALNRFKQGLAQNPNDALARFYLGQALFGLQRNAEAAAEYRKSLALDGASSIANEARDRLNLADGYAMDQSLAGNTYVSEEVFDSEESYGSTTYCTYKSVRTVSLAFDGSGALGRLRWRRAAEQPGNARFDGAALRNELWSAADQRTYDRLVSKVGPGASANIERRLNEMDEQLKAIPQQIREFRTECQSANEYSALRSVRRERYWLHFTILESTERKSIGQTTVGGLDFLENGRFLRLTIKLDGEDRVFVLKPQ
jgi:tetratricopeptide (TPR) repeat protein